MAQGVPVTTVDVDIVYEQSYENIKKILAFLESGDAVFRRPDDKIITPTEAHFKTTGHRLFDTKLGPLYILGFIEENNTYNDLVEYSVEIDFFKYKILVLDLKKIVELKKSSTHPKDIQQLPVLRETSHQIESKSPLSQGEELGEGE